MGKVRENRLRLAAQRQGLALVKSRRRDPRAIGHGCYCLVDRWAPRVVGVLPGGGFGLVDAPAARGGAERFAAWMSLETVERLLVGGLSGTIGKVLPGRPVIQAKIGERCDARVAG